jgi:NTE family protein
MINDSSRDGARGHRSRALVLGGGGPVGRAWEIGLLEGFAAQGIDLGTADLIIGTMVELRAAMVRAAQSPEPEQIRAEIGKMALNAETISEEASLSRFAPFVGQAWPNQIRATTVNAGTGQLQIWDASSGAPLERALAASTAIPGIWPPITINGERYIDGGVRSMLNADLAIGSDIVIVVSCFALTAPGKAGTAFFTAINAALLAELDRVRDSGAALAVIEPHSEFLVLTKHGAAMMDSNLIPEAYRLGHITAVGEAESVGRVWNST